MDEAIVDANVLLRLLTGEPSELASRANTILEVASEHDITLLVSALTLAEVVYVLESVYKWDRDTIANELTDLIETSRLTFPESAMLLQTLGRYKSIRQLHFAMPMLRRSRYPGSMALWSRLTASFSVLPN